MDYETFDDIQDRKGAVNLLLKIRESCRNHIVGTTSVSDTERKFVVSLIEDIEDFINREIEIWKQQGG